MKVQKLVGVLLAATLLAFTTVEATAAPFTFTYAGSGSGTLAGTPFSVSDFVITATVDTNNRLSFGNGFFIDHSSASIAISGLGTFNFLTGTQTFVNNAFSIVGFSRAGTLGADLFNGPTDGAFAAWDMLSPIGPIAGTGSLLQWSAPQVNTTGGVLVFNSGSASAVFQAVPEPATLSLLAFGGLALLRRRRRAV